MDRARAIGGQGIPPPIELGLVAVLDDEREGTSGHITFRTWASGPELARSCASRILVLASCITMKMRRTTVSAPGGALGTLQAEAQRRGVPLSTVLREAVEEKAQALRGARRPRVGVARSTDGRSAAEVTDEPVADHPR